MTGTQQFDAAVYKQTTQQQWDTAAAAWDAWGPTLEEWLGEATATMLDLARIGAGARVLDVAAGAGGQSLAAARRVGPAGRVLATDLSAQIMACAERRFAEAGLANATARTMDGEDLDVQPGHFDAVMSRLGLIYFPDRARALAGMRGALRRGGRVSVVVYAGAEDNGFFSVPVSIIRRRAGLRAPLPGQPGPFSLGAPGSWPENLPTPVLTMSRCARWTRRSGCRRPRTACDSSASRSVRCTRCCPA